MTVTYSAQYSYRRRECSEPGQIPICVYSRRCQPEMMLIPNRPCEIESIVTAMRAAIGGGKLRTAQVANSWMRFVTAASPAISERFQIVIPELRWTAKPVQFDHRQRKIEAEAFRLLDDLAIEVEGGPVLRRGRRDQPAVVADRDEDAQFHGVVPRH